ncbi:MULTISPECIES: alpha/beta fold hydrolase [unclassified Microbacterium]|uniref:alpha/beta fold hydrolase n=1 Tax=unclassified Microbacterium TaxID=2609290 RepID=UPI0012F9333D|nr:alpha/beta hydrolase [Microbacterium sp. MAH-37]MVQ42943.1 alpha/beta fold hydrolase [Microbacterium sp. MAH-37]
MTTFVLIHGGGDTGWSFHLLAAQLEARGHEVIAPDLPAGDDALRFEDYADAVVELVGTGRDVLVLGHSFGGFTAPLVAARLPATALVLLAGMVPLPGESPEQWWGTTSYAETVAAQAARDGGLTGNEDPYVSYYHDVPRVLAEEALRRERDHPSATAYAEPWPGTAWPDVPTHFLLCTEDRVFPADLFRRIVPERLGTVPDEMPGGHCVALSRPAELADRLERYASPDPA